MMFNATVNNKTNWSFKTLSKTIYRNVSFDKEQFRSWRGVLDTTVCDDVYGCMPIIGQFSSAI
jgi:hypothetical protein